MIRGLAVFLGTTCLVAACTSGDEHTTRIVSFNYCGNVCQHGGDEGLSFIVDLVRDEEADAVLLQEVCRTQAERIAADLWPLEDALHYVSTYVGDFGGRNECEHDDYGIAVVAPGIVDRSVLALPNPGLDRRQIDRRSMPCVELDGGKVVCTTHLVRSANDPTAHAAQVDAFLGHAAALIDQHDDVVVAGDLNDDLRAFRTLFAGGSYLTTVGARVDHAFASAAAYRRMSVGMHECACSDHEALVVTAST